MFYAIMRIVSKMMLNRAHLRGIWYNILSQLCQQETDNVCSQVLPTALVGRGQREGGVRGHAHLGAIGYCHQREGNATKLQSNQDKFWGWPAGVRESKWQIDELI